MVSHNLFYRNIYISLNWKSFFSELNTCVGTMTLLHLQFSESSI